MFAYATVKRGEKRTKIIMSLLKLRQLLISAQLKIKYKKSTKFIGLHARLFAMRINRRFRSKGPDGKA